MCTYYLPLFQQYMNKASADNGLRRLFVLKEGHLAGLGDAGSNVQVAERLEHRLSDTGTLLQVVAGDVRISGIGLLVHTLGRRLT